MAKMEKAGLKVLEGKRAGSIIAFQFNPETISVSKSVELKEHNAQGGDSGEKEFTHGVSRTLKIGELWFDTYDDKSNVRSKFIDPLEELTLYDETIHKPPKVLFVYGKFMQESDAIHNYPLYVKSIQVDYKMFLPDGTPVRAKVSLELIEATSLQEQMQKKHKSSPDHAKVYVVQRGDTLQSISYKEYDTVNEWRRIAEANGIDDPMDLEPGLRLLVPPILK